MKQIWERILIRHVFNATANGHIPFSTSWHVENHTCSGHDSFAKCRRPDDKVCTQF